MSVHIVDLLEMVEVNEDDGKFVAVTIGAIDFRVEDEVEMPGVVKRGAVIGDGELVDALHVTGVFQRDGGIVRQALEDGNIFRAEAGFAEGVDEFDDPQHVIMRLDGHADDRARLGVRQLIHLGREARIIAGIFHQHGLAVLSHPPRHSLTELQANIPELFRAGCRWRSRNTVPACPHPASGATKYPAEGDR